MNFTINKVICSCIPNESSESDTEKEIGNNNQPFANQVFTININVMKCIRLIPKWGNLSINIGFWLLGFLFISSICLSSISIYFGLTFFYSEAHQSASTKFNPSKLTNNSFLNYFGKKPETSNNSIHSSSRKLRDKSKIQNNKEKNIFSPVNKDSLPKVFTFNIITKNSKDPNVSTDENTQEKLELQFSLIKDYSLIRTKYINYYPYSIALSYDNRNLFQIFWDFFRIKYIMLRSLFRLSKFEIIGINILVCIFYIGLTFTINGLFFYK